MEVLMDVGQVTCGVSAFHEKNQRQKDKDKDKDQTKGEIEMATEEEVSFELGPQTLVISVPTDQCVQRLGSFISEASALAKEYGCEYLNFVMADVDTVLAKLSSD